MEVDWWVGCISFGHVEFELPIMHPNDNVK